MEFAGGVGVEVAGLSAFGFSQPMAKTQTARIAANLDFMGNSEVWAIWIAGNSGSEMGHPAAMVFAV